MERIGKRLLSLTLAVLLLVTLLPAQAIAAELESLAENRNASGTFVDVPEGAWFYDAVEYVSGHDIFRGTSDTEFSPYGTMTRAMMVTVLGRLSQVDPADYTGARAFTDVKSGSWYAPYVAWAVAAGITDGVGQGRFAPDEPVTRAQMAAFLWRYFQHIGARLPETVTDSLPGDYSAIPAYAREAAADLWRCGIFQGDGDNSFAPDRQLTRAEAAELLMRIDTHLVDIGEKEYPGETGDASAGESGQSGNTGSGGSRPGGSGDPDDPDDPGASTEDLLYEPESSGNQTTATQQDVDPSFSIEVKSSDSSLRADEVADRIIATDLSAVDENGDAVTGCIRVSGSGGTYTITGVHSAYDEQGMPMEGAGFAPGHTYKIVLDDDRLTFAGQAESVREYDFTVIRQEDMNLELADGMVYIPAGEIDDIVINGQHVDELDVALVSVGEDGIVQDASADTTGHFAYVGTNPIHVDVGDMVAVYEGTRPNERGTEDSAEDNGVISYVKITADDDPTDNIYSFEGAEMEEVVDTPDMFPLPDTYLEEAVGNTIQVPASAFVFSGDLYTEMGLDSSATVDVGDYIAFYSGYLDPSADENEDFSAEPTQQYAQITGVTQDENGGTYTITYEEVELQDILDSMNTYVENDVDVGAMMTEEEISDLEDSLEAEAEESGFARAAAEEIARLALQTNSLEQVRDELGLSSLTINGLGSGAIVTNNASLLAAPGSGSQISIELGIPRASVSTTLEHFSGMDGLRVELNIPFTLVIQQSGGWELRLEFDPTFVQELRIGVSASVDVIWDNWWYIVWWIDEFEVTANVDVYTFTDIDIDVDVITDDGQADTPEQIEELTNFVDEIKSLLDGGGADPETAESLAERYQEMLQNDSEWVDLFSQRILHVKQNVAKIITIYIDFDFVVGANVNVYIGLDFTYELGRRYIFTIRAFDGTATSDTVSLVPEQYTLDVYVMGKLGLRIGLRATIGVALIHKAVASVEVVAEIGPYIELYGFFYYQLYHLENKGTTSKAAGAMYVEVGLYAEMSANLSAIGGLLSWNPEIFSVQLPLWNAGDRYPVIRVADQTFDPIEFQFANPAGLPVQRLRLVSMDLKTGEETTRYYDWDEFEITTTNDAVYYDETYHVLWARQPYADLDLIEEGQVLITWAGDNGCLAFNAAPIQYTIDFHWDKLLPGGYQIFLITETEPSWIEYKMSYASEINYDAPTIYNGVNEDQVPADFSLAEVLSSREGYRFTGWKDASGVFYPATTDDPASVLPATMPAPDDRATYYYAQWERTPVEYTVKHFYEAGDVMEIPDGVETRQIGDQTYYLYESTTGTALMGDYITCTDYTPKLDGYAPKPYYQGSGWMSNEDAVLENYYDLETYPVTFTLENGEGDMIGSYVYDIKYGTKVKTPDFTVPAGYTFSGWAGVPDVMPGHSMSFTAVLTPNENTPFTVEHYVQNERGTYVWVKTETGYGTTDTEVGAYMDGLLMEVDNTTPTYDDAITINGDGSTVVKVRYARTDLHTATFYNAEGRIVGRDYFTTGSPAVTPPELEVPEGQMVQWYYVDENNERVYGIPDPMPDNDMDFYAYLLDGEQVTYQVEHYLENADGTYPDEPAYTDNKTGVAGGPVEVTRPEGLSTAEYGEGTYTATTISPDGTTVVRVEYPRMTYSVTYHLNQNGASFVDPSITGDTYTVTGIRYGAAVDLLDGGDVSCEGVVLAGWYTDAACTPGNEFTAQSTMPAQNVDLYAKWTDGYVITVNHYQELADHTADATEDVKYDMVNYETETITVAKDGSTTSYAPAVKTYEHFKSPEPQSVTFGTGSTYTVNYYYDREVYSLEITYETGTYADGTVTPGTGTYKGTARYGQTLTTVFSGMQDGRESSDDGHYSLNYGYLLSGFHETNDPSVTHSTMPAPAEGSDTVALTAEWEGDTFTIYIDDYDGRMDLYEELAEKYPDRVKWDDYMGSEDTIILTLTYGESFTLQEVDGLLGLAYNDNSNSDVVYEAGDDICTARLYNGLLNYQNRLYLCWETTNSNGVTVIYSEDQLDSMTANGSYRLGADLDYSRYTMSNHYTYDNKTAGTYHLDGAGHIISNLKINTSGYDTVGLFNALGNGSTITDLTLDGITITSSDSGPKTIGILAGQVSGDVTITNVTVTNSSIGITGTMGGTSYYVGGLVGQVAEDATLTLTDCTVSEITDVSGAHAGNFYAGGFVGYGEISSNSDNNTNKTNWSEIGGPASGDGENTEGGEMLNTLPEDGKNNASTDDSSNTEDVGDGDSATGEPTEPTDPGTDDATPPPEGETGEPGTDPGEETDASDPEQDNSEGGNPSSGDPVEPLA